MTPFANALRLRNAKVKWLEGLAEMPGNIAFIRYEDLNRNPLGCLRALAAGAGLARVGRLSRIRSYKGAGQRAYAPRRQPATTPADLRFLADTLDTAQEARLG
ncbi:MAG: hypothetical protein ACPGFC_12450, partial [Paracoccaceae bacterium]